MSPILKKQIQEFKWGIFSARDFEKLIEDLIGEVEDLSEELNDSVSPLYTKELEEELYDSERKISDLEYEIEKLKSTISSLEKQQK